MYMKKIFPFLIDYKLQILIRYDLKMARELLYLKIKKSLDDFCQNYLYISLTIFFCPHLAR